MGDDTGDAEECCIQSIFEGQARRRPHAIAVSLRGESITYEQLNCRANFLAAHLQAAGVGAADVVALSMRRSIDMIVSMLAILKCGAAYLPLDDSNPVSRSKRCLDDARVKHLVSDRDCSELCGNEIMNISTVDSTLFCSMLRTDVSARVRGDDKAYVMFTSGSTGKPKGVLVPHRAVTRLVVDTNYIQIAGTDKILQFSPTSFDASTFEIWGALLNGAALVLYSEATLDPNALRRDITDNGVTIIWLTAALFHLIAHRYIGALKPLKVLLAGGDVLSPKAVNSVLDALPGITVINGYGPTENTTFTCCHRMTVENRPPAHGVPIGKPISGTQVFILDGGRQRVERGEVGELFVGGNGVALGYLNAPADGSFFRDPTICDGLIYRTGDLVRENSQGELEFIGRADDQVKIRGFRVSVEEIKLSILKIGGVIDAIVLPRQEESGDQLLVAYVKTQQGCELDIAQTRRQLSTFLPRYMIPDKIVLSPDLPITRNGKLDRTLLMSSTL
jgi:amino acid adenylation domain-containing protein